MAGSIHIKLDYPEALSLKRDSLILEKDILEAIRYLRNYNQLRAKEFALKAEVKKDMNSVISLISSMEALLPKEEAGEISVKGARKMIEKEEAVRKMKSRIVEKKKTDIEREIDEIRAKLAALGGEGL